MTRHVFLLKPRWSDIDAYGHVNNVTWLEYLQEARVDMLFVHAPRAGAERLAEGVLVVGAEIRYLRPMSFRQEPYRIEMWISELRRASFTVGYEITERTVTGARIKYGTASTRLAPVDMATGRPRRLTATEHSALASFVE